VEDHVTTWLDQAKKNAGWLIFFGVVEIIAGMVAIISPLIGGVAIAVVVGLMFLVGGGARLFSAFMADSFGSGALTFIWGLIVAATGFYMFSNPGVALATLTLVLSMVLFVDGIMRIVVAFQMKPASGWGWMAIGGVLGILLAIMIWRQFPLSGVWAVGTFAGISLLFSGITTVSVGSAARKGNT
jgi:uncharacterized membrane protein HdeD (DUF308 family)